MAKNLRGGTSHIHVSAQGACEINAISPPAPPPRSPAPGRAPGWAPAFARRPRDYVGRAHTCEPCRARRRRTREFLLRQAGLEPGRRHEPPIDHDGGLPRPRVGLPLRIGEGVLKPGEEARPTAPSRRRPGRDRGQIVGQQLCLHVQIVFGLHVHEPLRIDLEETAEA